MHPLYRPKGFTGLECARVSLAREGARPACALAPCRRGRVRRPSCPEDDFPSRQGIELLPCVSKG